MYFPEIVFKKVYEHDIDLLILEEFILDRSFARLFLNKLALSDDYFVCKAIHSLSDADGESDISLILQYPNRKVALLIEDKIDAPTMPEQSARYHLRAQHAEARGEYDTHFVMLAAPAEYHKKHELDPNAVYEHRICYEELLEYFCQSSNLRHATKRALLECALREKKTGYQLQESPAVTRFWSQLRQFCKDHYPQLQMVGKDTPKGNSARWPEFRTTLGTLKVIYKSQDGYVDLEFPQYGSRISDLLAVVGDRMSPPMQAWPTGKSASIRLENKRWVLDFSQDFDSCRDRIDEVLQAVCELCKFASTINYSDLY